MCGALRVQVLPQPVPSWTKVGAPSDFWKARGLTQAEVVAWFDQYEVDDFARAGTVAGKSIQLPEGPLPQFQQQLHPAIMPSTRREFRSGVTYNSPHRLATLPMTIDKPREECAVFGVFNTSMMN